MHIGGDEGGIIFYKAFITSPTLPSLIFIYIKIYFNSLRLLARSCDYSKDLLKMQNSEEHEEEQYSQEEEEIAYEEEQEENDGTLLKAKLARNKAEANYQTRLNRIALLEAEEKKAQKNFEETKGKARKIMDLKIRNKQQDQEKQRQRQQQQEEVNRRNEQIRQYNEAKKDNQTLQKSMLIQNLARQVAQIKDEKAFHNKIADQINQEEKQKQTNIVQSVRNQEKELQLSKKKTWEQKQLQAQLAYEAKMRQEQEVKNRRMVTIPL